MTDQAGKPREEPLTAAEQARVTAGLPFALQVARRVARHTRVLPADELESIARLSLTTVVRLFEPERGSWKSFVCAHVGFALSQALRKERRCASIPVDDAVRAGLAHVEGLSAPASPLSGTDEDAYGQLIEIVSEVADVLALHASATSPRTKAAVDQAVSELPPLEGRVISLHYLEQKTFRQIAAETGSNLTQVFRAHARALPKLRRKLRGPGQ